MGEAEHQAAEQAAQAEVGSFWDRTADARDAIARQTRSAADDIRIKLVEEGWTGRAQTTPEVGPPSQSQDPQGLYGQSPQIEGPQIEGPQVESPQVGIEAPAAPTAPAQANAADVYGQAPQGQSGPAQATTADLYGQAPGQATSADLYGQEQHASNRDAVEHDGPER